MLPAAITPDQVDLSYLDALEESELARQREIVKARLFHEGEQPTFLTDRMKAFLNTDDETTFRMNVVRSVVVAVAERLLVKGFDITDKKQADWAWTVWLDNLMDAKQYDVHEAAVRDGEHFVIVDWDAGRQRPGPRFTPHKRYTSTEVEDGDGDGCLMVYPDDDWQQKPLYAIKYWSEWVSVNGKNKLRRRATVYYPNRIERFAYSTHWERFIETGKPWPQPWLAQDGLPLGLPVIHFKNPGLRCEAKDGWPIQNGTNKSYVDLLAAGDTTAFRIFKALGFVPTSDGKTLAEDGSNQLVMEPGQIVGTAKSKQDADFDAIDGADLAPLLELTQQQVLWLAVTTSTPVGRFMSTRQVAAEGTLKQQDDPLIAKVELRQALFGNAWEECLGMARRLNNAVGQGTEPGELDESAPFETTWNPAAKRSQAEEQAELTVKKTLGIPTEQLWAEMGYSPEQIKNMQAMPEHQARLALMKSGLNAMNSGGEG